MLYLNRGDGLFFSDLSINCVTHLGWPPLLATLGDNLIVDSNLGANDLDLCIFHAVRRIAEEVVLEGYPVSLKGELKLCLVKIDCGFDSANLV